MISASIPKMRWALRSICPRKNTRRRNAASFTTRRPIDCKRSPDSSPPAQVSATFGFYVANFSSYDKTYGALAGVIVFLLWLWLTNLALLFGAELDAELERGRELQAGMPAEHTIQLPARDTRKSDKAAEKERSDIARGRRIRLTHGQGEDKNEDADSDLRPHERCEKERTS